MSGTRWTALHNVRIVLFWSVVALAFLLDEVQYAVPQ